MDKECLLVVVMKTNRCYHTSKSNRNYNKNMARTQKISWKNKQKLNASFKCDGIYNQFVYMVNRLLSKASLHFNSFWEFSSWDQKHHWMYYFNYFESNDIIHLLKWMNGTCWICVKPQISETKHEVWIPNHYIGLKPIKP